MLKIKKTFCACALLAAIIFCSCDGALVENPKIGYKSYTNSWDQPMPKGVCRFGYKERENGGFILFEDSCKMYNVGDPVSKK